MLPSIVLLLALTATPLTEGQVKEMAKMGKKAIEIRKVMSHWAEKGPVAYLEGPEIELVMDDLEAVEDVDDDTPATEVFTLLQKLLDDFDALDEHDDELLDRLKLS